MTMPQFPVRGYSYGLLTWLNSQVISMTLTSPAVTSRYSCMPRVMPTELLRGYSYGLLTLLDSQHSDYPAAPPCCAARWGPSR